MRRARPKPVIGWREWLGLPELGVDRIKAKVDTGARTSALHAFDIEPFEVDGAPWVRFVVHPLQRDVELTVVAEAPMIDRREVRSSSGKTTLRPVVRTEVQLGEERWPIELSLVPRDLMSYRMLLGRTAIRLRFQVDPGRSFLASPRPAKKKTAAKKKKTAAR